jgi:uncharacterized protein YqfA (UPF0365 family)
VQSPRFVHLRATLGYKHPDTLNTMGNLALLSLLTMAVPALELMAGRTVLADLDEDVITAVVATPLVLGVEVEGPATETAAVVEIQTDEKRDRPEATVDARRGEKASETMGTAASSASACNATRSCCA